MLPTTRTIRRPDEIRRVTGPRRRLGPPVPPVTRSRRQPFVGRRAGFPREPGVPRGRAGRECRRPPRDRRPDRGPPAGAAGRALECAGLAGGPRTRGLVGGAAAVDRYASEPAIPPTRPAKRPAVSSTRDKPVDRTPVQTGPSWEKARRYEAYPTIKTRTGMPDIPRAVLLAGALGIAALALFFLPALLGIGSDDGGSPSASPSASAAVATPSAAPTASRTRHRRSTSSSVATRSRRSPTSSA